jgi:multidrug efflux system membrane fusion protein
MKYGIMVGIGIALAGCSDKNSQMAYVPPPVPVHTASVEVRDLPLYFEAMGVIRPSRTAVVKPQVSGIIKEVHFTEGEWIEEGALLYTLEEAPYGIRVQEAEAQRDQNLAHLDNVRKKLQRYRSLTRQALIAEVEWDELETKVALYEAMLKADGARLAAARLDLERCKILSPIAGFASRSALDAGNMASGDPLVTLTQKDPLFVDFMITEKELQQVATVAPKIKVFAAGNDGCMAEGVVTFLDHAIRPETGLLAASGKLDTTSASLLPGQSVRVRLFFGTLENARLIPVRAVRTNREGPYIFTVNEDQTVEVHAVTLGAEEKGMVVIGEGWEGTGKVVTDGQLRLFPGSKIEEIP